MPNPRKIEVSRMNEKQLQKKLKQGWNTWDVRSLTSHVFLPDNFALRFAVMDAATRTYVADFGWPEVERFGPHAIDGSYTCIDLKTGAHSLRIETAADGRKFAALVTPKSQEPFYLHIEASLLWGTQGSIKAGPRAIEARAASGTRHAVSVSAKHDPPPSDPSVQPHIALPMTGPVAVCCNASLSVAQAHKFIAGRREAYFATEALHADGNLGDGLHALQATVAWNTIYDPITDRIMTPVSRMWARGNCGGFVLFEWDNFFLGLLASTWSKEVAYANVLDMLGEIVPEGHVPNYVTPQTVSRDRSEPPVGAYCVLKLWQAHRDVWFIRECFDRLVQWNRFWFEKRDHNNSGLLEWGSDPYPFKTTEAEWLTKNIGRRQGAMWESGLDNSPMWDDAVFNEELHCLELKDVGLNSLVALDCQCLAALAAALGKDDIAREMFEKGHALQERIEKMLWDPKSNLYLNRHWDGKLSPRISPCNFYPLTAGIPDPERARKMIDEHLLNPKEFWGTYVIPSIARNDKAYKDQQYWRGRIWGPMNFIVFEGLRRYDLDDVAGKFAQKSLDLLLKEWRAKSHVHENYNATTGEGCDVKSSDANYHWGALLAHIALEQLIDVEPFGEGLRFGCGIANAGRVENVQLLGHRYSVISDGGLNVAEDGKPLLATDKPAAIRNFHRVGKTGLAFEVRAKSRTRLTIFGHERCRAHGGKFHAMAVDDSGYTVSAWFVPKGVTRVEAE